MNNDPFDACHSFTLGQEGGYSNNPSDPGGATMEGLTMADLWQWDRDATVADLQNMPLALRDGIYRSFYWQPIRGADLGPGLDLMVYDMGVNAGVGTSAKILQRLLGVDIDGCIGPLTCLAVRGVSDPALFITRMYVAQLGVYQLMRAWPVFGNGWAARAGRRRDAAMARLPA